LEATEKENIPAVKQQLNSKFGDQLPELNFVTSFTFHRLHVQVLGISKKEIISNSKVAISRALTGQLSEQQMQRLLLQQDDSVEEVI